MFELTLIRFAKNIVSASTVVALSATPIYTAPATIAAPKLAPSLNSSPNLTPIHCHDEGPTYRPPQGRPQNPPAGPGLISADPISEGLLIQEPFVGSPEHMLLLADCISGPSTFGKEPASKVLIFLKQKDEHCRFIPEPYLIDCIAAHYEEVAEKLSSRGEQGQVKKAYEKAASKLRSIVSQTQDKTKAPKRFAVKSGSKPSKSPRPLRAVAPAKQKAATRAATKVVSELKTTLLRSAERSDERMIYFQQVASATDSDKLLLRS